MPFSWFNPCVLLARVAVLVGLVSVSWAGAAFSVIHSFSKNDGAEPTGALVLDASGNLYGTTDAGGGIPTACLSQGCGVVFKLTRLRKGGWGETVLHSFEESVDGSSPWAGLSFDPLGTLYGTTVDGSGPNFGGLLFALKPSSQEATGWTFGVVRRFCRSIGNNGCKYGYEPDFSGVVIDSAGRLYGTLREGGTNQGRVAYQLTPTAGSWKNRVLYDFCVPDCSDGFEVADSTPILDKNGNLYGVANKGGLSGCQTGCGVVFENAHTAHGWKQKILYKFHGPDGSNPFGGLVFDGKGNLYGTTQEGGKYGNGTVFRLTPQADGTWKETVLHNFHIFQDGSGPVSTMIFDKAGSLYGTSAGGSTLCSGGCGVVYRLTPGSNGKWMCSVLHRFTDGKNDGAEPYSSLVFDKSYRHLYGTTAFGGADNVGTVYEITP